VRYQIIYIYYALYKVFIILKRRYLINLFTLDIFEKHVNVTLIIIMNGL